MKVILVCGARPNFMKIDLLIRAIENHNAYSETNLIEPILVHTGQHYDYKMSQAFFTQWATESARLLVERLFSQCGNQSIGLKQ